MSVICVAAVQPRSGMGDDERRHADDVVDWIERAANEGTDLIVFPEEYPGPANPGSEFDAFTPLIEAAARRRVHVVASRIEPAETQGHHMTLHLIGDDTDNNQE